MAGTIADPRTRHLRAKKAIATRNGKAVPDVDRQLAAARLEAYIKRVVADAPALTCSQRDRLAMLLRKESP
jgi:hypothetical protein